MKSALFTSILSLSVSCLAVTSTQAKKTKLEIGADAPTWTALPGNDGKKHSFEDLKDAHAIVVVFTCNSCPVAQGYEKRLAELATAYQKKGVVLIAINPNKGKAEDLQAMISHAKERKFPYPYLQGRITGSRQELRRIANPRSVLAEQGAKDRLHGSD